MRFATTLLVLMFACKLPAQIPTWSEDVAPIIYKYCAACHHEGAIAPFDLLTYDDVVIWSDAIHHAIEEREMPPWPADPSYRHFQNEVQLSLEEIEKIHNWIELEFPIGDLGNAPEIPSFPLGGSQLEEIDFTLKIEPYTLDSDSDIFRWFVFENPYDETIYINQIEVIADQSTVVHHADVSYDITGASMEAEIADPLSGFGSAFGSPNYSFYMNAWQPGGNLVKYPDGWGIEVPPEADFVFEIHYGPGGLGLVDETKMNFTILKNVDTPRSIEVGWLLTHSPPVLTDGPLFIPANEVVSFHQEYTLDFDMSLIAICPHMHFLGDSYKIWAETPDGETIPLIYIDKWDLHWQKYYYYPSIQVLPAGTKIFSEGYYDNTLANHDNPSNPPIDVSLGLGTEDEMMLTFFIYAPYQEGDEFVNMEDPAVGIDVPRIESKTVTISPNPVVDEIIVEINGDFHPKHFSVQDLNGRVVQEGKFRENKIHVGSLNAGFYHLVLIEGDIRIAVKFVKL